MRRLAALVLAGFSLLFTTVFASSATAATTDCPSGWLCVWEHPNYNGRMFKFSGDNPDWGLWDIADHDSSWYNHTNRDVCVYTETQYRGGKKVVRAQTSSPSDVVYGDRGSSNRFDNVWGIC